MNINLDLACVALACVMHNQAAVSRYEKSRAYGYEAQGWKDLEGGVHGKCQTSYKGLRGIRRLPRGVCKPGRPSNSKILGGVK